MFLTKIFLAFFAKAALLVGDLARWLLGLAVGGVMAVFARYKAEVFFLGSFTLLALAIYKAPGYERPILAVGFPIVFVAGVVFRQKYFALISAFKAGQDDAPKAP